MGAHLLPWRDWRFELTGLFRAAGYSDQVIRKMDWGEFRSDWLEGSSANDVFNENTRSDDAG